MFQEIQKDFRSATDKALPVFQEEWLSFTNDVDEHNMDYYRQLFETHRDVHIRMFSVEWYDHRWFKEKQQLIAMLKQLKHFRPTRMFVNLSRDNMMLFQEDEDVLDLFSNVSRLAIDVGTLTTQIMQAWNLKLPHLNDFEVIGWVQHEDSLAALQRFQSNTVTQLALGCIHELVPRMLICVGNFFPMLEELFYAGHGYYGDSLLTDTKVERMQALLRLTRLHSTTVDVTWPCETLLNLDRLKTIEISLLAGESSGFWKTIQRMHAYKLVVSPATILFADRFIDCLRTMPHLTSLHFTSPADDRVMETLRFIPKLTQLTCEIDNPLHLKLLWPLAQLKKLCLMKLSGAGMIELSRIPQARFWSQLEQFDCQNSTSIPLKQLAYLLKHAVRLNNLTLQIDDSRNSNRSCGKYLCVVSRHASLQSVCFFVARTWRVVAPTIGLHACMDITSNQIKIIENNYSIISVVMSCCTNRNPLLLPPNVKPWIQRNRIKMGLMQLTTFLTACYHANRDNVLRASCLQIAQSEFRSLFSLFSHSNEFFRLPTHLELRKRLFKRVNDAVLNQFAVVFEKADVIFQTIRPANGHPLDVLKKTGRPLATGKRKRKIE